MIPQLNSNCASTQKHVLSLRFPYEELFSKVLEDVAIIMTRIYSSHSPEGAMELVLIAYLSNVRTRAEWYQNHFEK